MKKIKYILLSVVMSSFVFQACSEDKMDDINKDKNNPENMESKYIITDVMTNTAFSVTGSDLAFYASIYSELLGGGHAQMHNAQIRDGEPTLSSTYNNSWNNIYRNLRSLKLIISKCSEGGSESGNYHTKGIAQILTAYNLAVLTDLWGDVPYSEALDPSNNFQPKVDKQEEIYKEIFTLLDASIENLNQKSVYAALGQQDLVYRGDIAKWKKVAYGLKARYLMRLSVVSPDYQSVIDNVDLSYKNETEDFSFQNDKIIYPFHRFSGDRDALFSSKTLYDIINRLDSKDPRLADYMGVNDANEVVLIDHSKEVKNSQSTYSRSGLSDASGNSFNSIYMQSYHEILFLKAEAQARLGKTSDAIATLELACKAALNKKQSFKYPDYKRVIPSNLTGKDLLRRIAEEKYISFFEIESIEAYNDIRRWMAMGENLIVLQHKDSNKFPQRYTYGNSDVSNNPNITILFGDGSYVYSESVWWAKGTR
ncbi:SusD/RagB family nutrient-binding outer membrane lipoprotein [Myroides odoratimimus]|uniref:SusD/RagB family nutrient-binding outer membrane lipoprotein n=1 Tax=Myroides odoratimimus TaxID=76832 RepID=UPI002577E29D|nr:SusD/RagB family nutrient-binding outer membrane lipoprotein [Myroides odoratimimus]MDM1493974.1 SusD/RagB family nutrient-binding outer membrane lipoprotein [Myroides odoratimimus]MDM1511441.1 SusD/RagB family nutrient-binding outer membrane lipoprotein [Myroides odoratimimus]